MMSGARAAPLLEDDALARALAPHVHAAPPHIGVEHEYRVLRDGVQLDFRRLIHDLGLGLSGLDPADPFAYRLRCGSALTCDVRDAELSTPPIAVDLGMGRRLRAAVERSLATLQDLLGDLTLDGYTTHVNVSVPVDIVDHVAAVYARHFAPAMMLMLDCASSPGLLVRPRSNGRLELCGWYVEPWRLPAVAAFAAGSVLACIRHVRGGLEPDTSLPPTLALRVEPAVIRYGYYVDRWAGGVDLYSDGRRAELPTADARRMAAQRHLLLAWQASRDCLTERVGAEDLALADRLVAGVVPLPCEQPAPRTPLVRTVAASADGDALASAHRPRRRRRFDLAIVVSTWDAVVFVVVTPSRTRRCFLCIPRPALAAFLDQLDRGRLDDILVAHLRSRPGTRQLTSFEQLLAPGIYDEIGPRGQLTPIEWPLSAPRARAGVA